MRNLLINPKSGGTPANDKKSKVIVLETKP